MDNTNNVKNECGGLKPSWWFTLVPIAILPFTLYIDISINGHGGIGLTVLLSIYIACRLIKHISYYFGKNIE